jgi:ATP-dependent helicase/nuclease subunit A
MELTKTQQLAVKATGKNILVSAGAGTGKTRVLVERFLHFVTTGQVPVTEILALTFTEKAANEMKSRIQTRLAELGLELARRELESAYISTIHAFAARLLREHPVEAGVDPDFRVIEAEESDLLKEQALDEVIETHCEGASDAFELLRVYGEPAIRGGLVKVLGAARQEGKTLAEFFKRGLSPFLGTVPNMNIES